MEKQTGPCIICGCTNYPPSTGGSCICPICDCGPIGPTGPTYEKVEKKEPFLHTKIKKFRKRIVKIYSQNPTGCGNSFGEILCWEIHENNQTFLWLAEKWGIKVSFLGKVIENHCNRL